MALPLSEPVALLDPFGGAEDLRSGTLRVLHEASFTDDPTRAIRAARYASRLDLAPDPGTLALLRSTDLGAVSADRRDAELAGSPASRRRPRLRAAGRVGSARAPAGAIERLGHLLARLSWDATRTTGAGAIRLAALEANGRMLRPSSPRPRRNGHRRLSGSLAATRPWSSCSRPRSALSGSSAT